MGNGLEVLIKSLLGGFVIVRTNAQNAIYATPVGRLDLFHHGSGVISTAIFQDAHPPLDNLLDEVGDLLLLGMGKARGLTGRRKDAEKVSAIAYLIFHKTLQRHIVYRTITIERSYEGYAQASENILCHNLTKEIVRKFTIISPICKIIPRNSFGIECVSKKYTDATDGSLNFFVILHPQCKDTSFI